MEGDSGGGERGGNPPKNSSSSSSNSRAVIRTGKLRYFRFLRGGKRRGPTHKLNFWAAQWKVYRRLHKSFCMWRHIAIKWCREIFANNLYLWVNVLPVNLKKSLNNLSE